MSQIKYLLQFKTFQAILKNTEVSTIAFLVLSSFVRLGCFEANRGRDRSSDVFVRHAQIFYSLNFAWQREVTPYLFLALATLKSSTLIDS